MKLMHQEMPSVEKNFETMSFSELEADPRYSQVVQEVSLDYLKNEQSEYYEREFTGEIDGDGYLVLKSGSSAYTKPSMNISGAAVEKVLSKVKERIRNNGIVEGVV